MAESYVVGVDFGTLSGRAVVVRVSDGAVLGEGVLDYPHGVVDDRLPGTDERLPADWALQVPADYLAVFSSAVPAALHASGISPDAVVGIGVDFTACTILPVTADGTPLCETAEFAGNKHAYVKLWKHHAAQKQADRINQTARDRGETWLARYGGLISSEWAFAKGLQLLEEAPEVYAAMDHWIEAADWVVWKLGGTYLRNACTAGYKGMLQDGVHPSPDFLAALNPDFRDFVADKVEHPIGQLGAPAGRLTAEAAAWTGLPEGIAVAVGNVDAHVALPAAQAVEAGQLVAIMGTSTCHIVNGDSLKMVPGMCGAVDGGVIQGKWGYEAGQSGVGDIFAWFTGNAVPPEYHAEAARRGLGLHEYLTELAAAQQVGEHGLIALDWFSGNRSVLVNHELTGLILGLTLASKPEDIYRALLESTAFGTKVIIDSFTGAGVPITEFIVSGGLKKNALLMQIYADVLNMPLSVATSGQGPALGSAIHAAVAAGSYPDVASAAAAMGAREQGVYTPDPDNVERYEALFAEYQTLHDYFGRGANDVMRRLGDLRRGARA